MMHDRDRSEFRRLRLADGAANFGPSFTDTAKNYGFWPASTRLALACHPDKGGSQEQMARINAAYEHARPSLKDLAEPHAYPVFADSPPEFANFDGHCFGKHLISVGRALAS